MLRPSLIRAAWARLASTIIMLVALSLVAFGLVAAAPGDAARKVLASGGAADQITDAQLEAERHALGLDRPLYARYLGWLGGTAHLDLGVSYVSKQPVASLLADRLPASAVLALLALVLGLCLSVPAGTAAALRAGSALDVAVRVTTLLAASLPGFWLALLALWLFSATLHLLPTLGGFTPRGLLLPVLVLGLRSAGFLTRLVRALVLDVASLDHVRVAAAKGLARRPLVRRHIVRVALAPVLALAGVDFAALVANDAVVEWVFAFPGLGRLGVEGALAGDVPVVMGTLLAASAAVIIANLVVDVLSALLDPRLRPAP